LLNPILNTSSKSRLQKVLPCRHPCHTWDLGLRTLCEVVSPNIHALNNWDCTDWPRVTWDPVWIGHECSSTLNQKVKVFGIHICGSRMNRRNIHVENKRHVYYNFWFCPPILKWIQIFESKNYVVTKTIRGAWCSHGEHSHNQYILIKQDIWVLVFGWGVAFSSLYLSNSRLRP
jgi:hypothetical protein